jgi:hypothetical protein
MRLLVVIPAYNEAENLPAVMADLAAHCPECDTLVVNDGSSDGTAELCRQNGYNLLDLPVNLGLAGELDKGFDIVIGSRFVTVRKPLTLRMAGSFLISFAMRIATGRRICDPTSGMRIFNRKMIQMFAHNLNYPPEPDTISYLLHCGAQMSEVQVDVGERSAGQSYLTFIRSAAYMLTASISILLVQWFRKNDLEALQGRRY